MRQVVAVERGGGPCTADCPFYTDEGKVSGVRGVPLKTHCRATMDPICVDCDVFNPHTVEKLEVTDAEWKAMQRAVGKRAKKERKLYPEDHKEIHAVGCEWTRRGASEHSDTAPSQPCGDKGKWNSGKSSDVKN